MAERRTKAPHHHLDRAWRGQGHAGSTLFYSNASFWSSASSGPNCSYAPASTLNSDSESRHVLCNKAAGMHRRTLEIGGLVALVALGMVGVAGFLLWPTRPEPQLLTWDDPATVARGRMVYRNECSACHGALEGGASAHVTPTGAATAPPHDASGHTWQHPDYALFQLTKTGEVAVLCRTLDENGMPQFGDDLSDQEIVDVLSYIKSTWPKHIRAEQDAINSLHAAQNAAYRALLSPSAF